MTEKLKNKKIKVVMDTGESFTFTGRYRRDLEKENWHYYEAAHELYHFRKDRMVVVIDCELLDERMAHQAIVNKAELEDTRQKAEELYEGLSGLNGLDTWSIPASKQKVDFLLGILRVIMTGPKSPALHAYAAVDVVEKLLSETADRDEAYGG